jgi:hypothetical protein
MTEMLIQISVKAFFNPVFQPSLDRGECAGAVLEGGVASLSLVAALFGAQNLLFGAINQHGNPSSIIRSNCKISVKC